jgi:hypothetical protein
VTTEPPIKPIIIGPHPLPRPGNPNTNDWALHDQDFPLEHRAQYILKDPTQVLRVPHFSLSQIAVWVFARDAEWIKHAFDPSRHGHLELPHIGRLEFRRLANGRNTTGGGERRLTLPDIERLAHALYRRDDIDGITLMHAMETVFSVARQYQTTRKRRT